MCDFAIFEDDASVKVAAISNEVSLKPERRQFGTVLSDANTNNVNSNPVVWKKDTSIVDPLSSAKENDSSEISEFPVNFDEENAQLSTALLLSSDGYFDEISTYLYQLEKKFQCKANYMSRQRDLSHSMRSVLVDWLVEVADEYKLHRRTLFLAVSMMDRFLSEMSVLRSKLQLLGATCMFIAAKFEEIYPPEATEFAYLTEDTYTVTQILKLERLVLRILDFQIAAPTTDVMCDRIIAGAHLTEEQTSLMNYLSELTLIFGEPFLQYLPSVTAAACACLSNICLLKTDEDLWSEELERLTGRVVNDFYYCLVLLGNIMHQAADDPNCRSVVARYQNTALCLPDRERISLMRSKMAPVHRNTLGIKS